MRWLAGKAAELQDCSPYKNNMVLDLVYEVFKRARDDGNLLLDPDLRVFGSIEDEQHCSASGWSTPSALTL